MTRTLARAAIVLLLAFCPCHAWSQVVVEHSVYEWPISPINDPGLTTIPPIRGASGSVFDYLSAQQGRGAVRLRAESNLVASIISQEGDEESGIRSYLKLNGLKWTYPIEVPMIYSGIDQVYGSAGPYLSEERRRTKDELLHEPTWNEVIAPRAIVLSTAAMERNFDGAMTRLDDLLPRIKHRYDFGIPAPQEFVRVQRVDSTDPVLTMATDQLMKWSQGQAAKALVSAIVASWVALDAATLAGKGAAILGGLFIPDRSIGVSEGRYVEALSPEEVVAIQDLGVILEIANIDGDKKMASDTLIRKYQSVLQVLLVRGLAYDEARRQAQKGE